MKVLKFGGSSVGSAERIINVKQLIEREKQPCIVVVSAFQGVTDTLTQAFDTASANDNSYFSHLSSFKNTHLQIITSLFPNSDSKRISLMSDVNKIIDEVSSTLLKVYSEKGDVSTSDRDSVVGSGELLSSLIISTYIVDSVLFDTRQVIKAEAGKYLPKVDFETTNDLIRSTLSNIDKTTILPGFVAGGKNGETVTLGRGGSDYSASIIAAALNSELLEIWTDVDGFMTADPKKVEKAYTIESLTYSEAMELSHFGAKVIYAPTLRPVYKANIPILVKNSLHPEATGTIINHESKDVSRSPIKGISSIDHIDLITLQGPAMVGISGISARLFGTLARNNISVIFITQASSEYSISLAVRPDDSEPASKAISKEFNQEVKENGELHIVVEKNLSIIAIVGERMKNTPGISATLFASLGRNGINIVAIAQGYSELNISVVIKHESLRRALNVIHDSFFLSSFMEVNLFLAGIGVVGGSLLQQLNAQQELLFREHNLKVNLLGVADEKKMLVNENGIPLGYYKTELYSKGEQSEISSFVKKAIKVNRRNSVFIDCTASAQVASNYKELLSGYISVVVANKIACSSEYKYYRDLKQTAYEKSVKFNYETTVGAGLPVIKTINDLILSGDKILKIEAVLSGTLNFIFNEISSTVPMSQAIKRARELGYSEPDPRIDLSGTDVVRKILILAREAGYPLEKEDVEINNFIPADCFEGEGEEFFKRVEKYDEEFEIKRSALEKAGKKWRFFATLDDGKAKVGLVEIDREHPSYNLEGSNNIILITTERYRELPMVIKGYGAGAGVTAAGVFADLMRVFNV